MHTLERVLTFIVSTSRIWSSAAPTLAIDRPSSACRLAERLLTPPSFSGRSWKSSKLGISFMVVSEWLRASAFSETTIGLGVNPFLLSVEAATASVVIFAVILKLKALMFRHFLLKRSSLQNKLSPPNLGAR